MQRLLNELLELSRIGRLMNAPERAPFESIAREAVSLVQGRLSARGVQVEIAVGLPEVFVDRARLIEVMQNLIDNAVKFMGDQTEPRIEIGVRDEKSRLVFFVKDNGLGIDPRYHDKVFGLFDKLDPKSEGTGIGLALVKRIITCTAAASGSNRRGWARRDVLLHAAGTRLGRRCSSPCWTRNWRRPSRDGSLMIEPRSTLRTDSYVPDRRGRRDRVDAVRRRR